MRLNPIIASHADRMANQLVDSTLESTRLFWRAKMGATDQEARDPRPFCDVLAERQQPSTPTDVTPA